MPTKRYKWNKETQLVGGLVAMFYFPRYWVSNHPNWLSYFSEGWPNHQPVLVHSGPFLFLEKSFSDSPGSWDHPRVFQCLVFLGPLWSMGEAPKNWRDHRVWIFIIKECGGQLDVTRVIKIITWVMIILLISYNRIVRWSSEKRAVFSWCIWPVRGSHYFI